jgi:hypothetical protein
MDRTPFTPILDELLSRVPGAYACALVDREGETVDYAGLGDPFDVKVAAAHLRIVMHAIEQYQLLGTPRWLVIRADRKSIIARALPQSYALVVMLRRRAGFTASNRAFLACERAICAEAGLETPVRGPAWYPVEVVADRRSRPLRVAGGPVEVMGSIVGLGPRERGFRVRIASGRELTLVRESLHRWYADEPVEPGA